MPQNRVTINQGSRIVSATFSDRAIAKKAIEALEEMGVSPLNLQVVVQLSTHAGQDLYATLLTDRGFNREDAVRYDQLIREGHTLVAVHNVVDPGPVIDVLHEYDGAVLGGGSGAVAGKAAEHRK